MPIKRRTPKNRVFAITPEAIDAFRKGDNLRLKRALGLRPWQSCPLDVEPDWQRPAWFDPADWELQQSLRAELEAADAR